MIKLPALFDNFNNLASDLFADSDEFCFPRLFKLDRPEVEFVFSPSVVHFNLAA